MQQEETYKKEAFDYSSQKQRHLSKTNKYAISSKNNHQVKSTVPSDYLEETPKKNPTDLLSNKQHLKKTPLVVEKYLTKNTTNAKASSLQKNLLSSLENSVEKKHYSAKSIGETRALP